MQLEITAGIPFQTFRGCLPELISSPDNRVFMALHRVTATTHIVTEAEIAEIITRVAERLEPRDGIEAVGTVRRTAQPPPKKRKPKEGDE